MSDVNKVLHPAWLKAMQNGALAEARAKAFLLDRFWVLERSADIEGADFIIQRRITGKNLLDREAPRLGVVQVKFFGTDATRHFVHKEYVLDDTATPREEFFLLCHSGDEEHPRAFIASGRDVHETFRLGTVEGREGYVLTYKQLTSTERFEIKNARHALDRIEHQLQLAEFTKNRQFISWALPSASQDLEAIEPFYMEPIDNGWGSIPEGFTSLKRIARDAMCKVEHIYNLLRKVTEATDPLEAEDHIEEIAYHCRAGYGNWSIRLPDNLYDDELFRVAKRHKRMVELLKADGLLDRFLALGEKLHNAIVDELEPFLPVEPDQVHCFTVNYDPNNLELKGLTSTIEKAALYFGSSKLDTFGRVDIPGHDHGVKAIDAGRLVCHWMPGRWYPKPDPGLSLAETLRNRNIWIHGECTHEIFDLKYGDKDGA